MTTTIDELAQVKAPFGATSTHRKAAITAVATIAGAVVCILVSLGFNVGLTSIWGFIGEILVVIGSFVSFWSLTSRLQCTPLNSKANPEIHMRNAPGAHWTFASNAGREMTQNEVNTVEPGFRIHIYVWRSVRLALAYAGAATTLTGAAIIVATGFAHSLF